MTEWTKESALSEIERLIEEAPEITQTRAGSERHTRWILNSTALFEDVFGRNSRYYLQLCALTWQAQGGTILNPGLPPHIALPAANTQAFIEHMDTAVGALRAAEDELRRKDIADVYEGKDTGPEASAIVEIIRLVETKLRKAVKKQPHSEKEVQDIFEALVLGASIEYRREGPRIHYSGKEYIPDFTFAKLDLALEVKFCVKREAAKRIIAEINDDILAYGTEYGNQLFVVYDILQIGDVDEFCSSFEQRGQGVLVRVVKH